MAEGGVRAVRSIGLDHGAKSLLRNYIRHTDSHNRHLEEAEMWQIYRKMKEKEHKSGTYRSDGYHGNKEETTRATTTRNDAEQQRRWRRGRNDEEEDAKIVRDPNIQQSYLYDERQAQSWQRRRGEKRAHMDEEEREERRTGSDTSTYWMRQLQKAEEEAGEGRWGHAGFKELYPEKFDSDRSTSSNDKKNVDRRDRGRKQKKSKKKKHKLDKSESKKKSKKRKRTKSKRDKKENSDEDGDDENDEDDDFSDEEEYRRRKKRRRNLKTESERDEREKTKTGSEFSSKKKKRRR